MSTDSRSAFAARPGFVADPTGVAAHYGNPLSEQRGLEAGRSIVELGDRGVVTVTGPDRLSWLNSLTSQSLDHLAPGVSTETLLLDPSGRLEQAARVLDDGETTWLLVDAAEAPVLSAWLDRMRFMLRVEVADRSADFATVGSFAPNGAAEPPVPAVPPVPAAQAGDVPLVWIDPWSTIAEGGVGYADDSVHPAHDWTYREALVAPADLEALAASEVPVAGVLALEALRIAAWRPRLATEADERTIPHELDWLRSAVHLSKGCYRGQETVAKVHNLGHPPRRLVMLHLDGSDNVMPAHGDVVLDGAGPDAREVGAITSVGTHHELGPIALAVVKRSTDPTIDLVVRVGESLIAAGQEVVVPPGAGAAAGVPRLPRLGAVRR
ncbi:CAF17-like 4Fe-4S cluster assembly/insertion protein YgfZ [Frondihabitans cladoniiphilus]|uniref:Folate-binding protein YgfZ n=1 Tax=Frondihabitans cladoniiphilus TaxID=715785 RepID=A0ABP8VW06_9MICO